MEDQGEKETVLNLRSGPARNVGTVALDWVKKQPPTERLPHASKILRSALEENYPQKKAA